jgi:hypothetical protein
MYLTPPSPRGWAAVLEFRPTGCGWWHQVHRPISV